MPRGGAESRSHRRRSLTAFPPWCDGKTSGAWETYLSGRCDRKAARSASMKAAIIAR